MSIATYTKRRTLKVSFHGHSAYATFGKRPEGRWEALTADPMLSWMAGLSMDDIKAGLELRQPFGLAYEWLPRDSA